MRRNTAPLLVSKDKGLLRHWREALKIKSAVELESFAALKQRARRCGDVVWLDLKVGDVPSWGSTGWSDLLLDKQMRIVAASSYPKDEEAIAALDQGCAGYCHAFSDPETLLQVHQVTTAGHVWIGQHLMQQLIQTANRAKPRATSTELTWDAELTAREREVAKLAAHGASNMAIAEQCDITERTVKAHLSAVFEKMGVADRLQLTLKVHGIQ
jgi:DNA-binding NarL/FixJ family response regulator